MMYEKFERISLVNILQNLVFIFLVSVFAHSMIWSDVGFLRDHKLKSKLEDNPELVEAYNNALLALEEEDYDEAEELAISALDVAIENLYPNDQMNQIIIIAGVIFAIMVIILIFGRKPEPKLPKPKVKIKPKVKTTKLSESEELLNKLRDEFK